MKREVNELGFEFYAALPENARPGILQDFVGRGGKKKVGMEYLTYSSIANVYYINTVREGTTGQKIQEYINAGILYVFTNQN